MNIAGIFDDEPPIPDVIEQWVTPEQSLPLVIRPDKPSTNLLELAAQYREPIRRKLLRHGGILFRGLLRFYLHSALVTFYGDS